MLSVKRIYAAFLCMAILKNITVVVCSSDHVTIVRCAENEECLQHVNAEVVSMIHSNMRNESDPCDNFWDYACGEWTAAPYYDHVDNFGAIDSYYVQRMQKYLQTDATNAADTEDIENLLKPLQTYYAACRDTSGYYLEMQKYFDELVSALSQTQKPWLDMRAALEEDANAWRLTDFNWLQMIAMLRRYGLNGVFLDESVGFAFNDSTQYVIELKMPDEGDNFESKYDFVNYFVEFGWIERATERHVKIAAEIYEFEIQLQKLRARHAANDDNAVTEDINEVDDDENEEEALTLQELKVKVPTIDWLAYFETLFEVGRQPQPQQLQLSLSDLAIEVEGIAYMRNLAELLECSDKRVICYYIIMRLCKYLLDIAPQITDKNCIDHMGVVMPLGMNYIYNRFEYKERKEDEKILNEILLNLKSQFNKYLQANKLNLTGAQQAYLAEKLRKMRLRLGNLPQNATLHYYQHYYDAANLSDTNFFHNHLEMLHFRTRKQHAAIVQQRQFDEATFYIYDDITQIRNAPYFVHQRNLLVVPMIFLQLPFFHHQLHPVLQYSIVGWILAHELNHGFETDGITLDADGNESLVGASLKRNKNFLEELECLQHTPTASLLERIADVNGFQLAFDAYFSADSAQNTQREFSKFEKELSLRELYFLNFAQFFCGNLPRPIQHDRDDVRVIEMLANLPEFSETYKCARGSRENPARKCQMWSS